MIRSPCLVALATTNWPDESGTAVACRHTHSSNPAEPELVAIGQELAARTKDRETKSNRRHDTPSLLQSVLARQRKRLRRSWSELVENALTRSAKPNELGTPVHEAGSATPPFPPLSLVSESIGVLLEQHHLPIGPDQEPSQQRLAETPNTAAIRRR
jgi:hypothetical protein